MGPADVAWAPPVKSADSVNDTSDTALISGQRRFCLALIAIIAVSCWFVPIRGSLWLDETGTYWIIKDGLATAITRSFTWSGPSPYYVIEWLFVQIGGKNEMVMRLPSVLAMAGATILLYRIGARLCDEETGLFAAVIFAIMHDLIFAAADARPYALTMMFLTAHVLALLRWLDTDRLADAAVATVFAILTVYGHTLLALGLVVPALYALWRHRDRPLPLIAMWTVTAFMLAPLFLQLRAYLSKKVHTFAEAPDFSQLCTQLAPPELVASLGASILLAYVILPRIRFRWRPARAVTMLASAWMLLTPAVVFLMGRTTSFRIFVPRYLISSAPGFALIFGSVIRSLDPLWARRLVAGMIAITSLVAFGLPSKFRHTSEDWREAIAAAQRQVTGTDIPVLIVSGFIEAQGPEDLTDPTIREVLFAPAVFYPLNGRVIHLPYRFDEVYLKHVLQTQLAGHEQFLLLTQKNTATETWLRIHMADLHFTTQPIGSFRGLDALRFRLLSGPERNPSAASP
jgi:uncharacterized membrane protein